MDHESKSIADYLALLKRRRKIVVASLIAISLLGVTVAYSIPPMYRSTSRFLIEQQDIPEDIVQSTVTSYVDEQIQEVRQRAMSSANMVELIDKYGLYPQLVENGDMQTAVDAVRENALLETEVFDVMNPRSGRAMLATISFTLSFDYSDPLTARDVAADIANLYITENVESRTGQVQETLEFILSDIERYEAEVNRTSEELAAFKEQNLGNLPELMNYNLQTIERTERQIDDIDREIRDAVNRQLQFASEIARLGPAETVYDADGQPILNPLEQLAALQREKVRLESIYSPQHPDVVSIQKEIDALRASTGGGGTYLADLEVQLAEARLLHTQNLERYSSDHPDVIRSGRAVSNLELQYANARQNSTPYSASVAPDDPYAQQLQMRIDAEEQNIRSLNSRKYELQTKLTELEDKVALSPQVEREYERLSRNNEMAVENLNQARSNFDTAQKAAKLESEGAGDRFTIIESANLPFEPYKPNRTAIILLAIVLSAGVGLILATIADTMDDTVKNSRDVVRLINTPPLAVIPYLETESEHAARMKTNGYIVALIATGIASAVIIASVLG